MNTFIVICGFMAVTLLLGILMVLLLIYDYLSDTESVVFRKRR